MAGYNYVFPTTYTESSTIRVYERDSWAFNGTVRNRTISYVMQKVLAKGFNAFFMTAMYNNSENYRYIWPFNVNADTIYCIDKNNPSIAYQRAGINQPVGTSGYELPDTETSIYQSTSQNILTQTINGITYNEHSNDGSPFPTLLVIMNYEGICYLNENNVTPITYTWEPFEQLNGNNGQFRMNLTQIKAEEIGDYTQTTLDSDGSKLQAITNQSCLLPFFQNMLLGVEEKIAWSGQNYLTMKAELDSSVTAHLQYKITLKFYYLSGVEAYSQVGYIRYPNTTSFSTIYPYLSIIYDDENEAAVVDLVYYDINNTPGVPTTRRYMYGTITWSTISPSEQQMYQLWVWLHGSDIEWESDDPYDTGSEDNGGDGGNPRPQDDIESPDAPTISGLDVGMVTIYNPTDTQLGQISDFLWTDNVIDNFKKYFNSFSDNIIGLYTLPYTPTNLPTKAFTVGKMVSETILNVPYLTDRYVKIDMGSYQVRPRWTSYLDYSPYTKIHIYLPGIGIQALDTDDIMSPSNKEGTLNENQGCLLELEYMLDLYTGLIVAFLYTTVEDRKSMKYQFSGKVGAEIPITGSDRTNMVKGLIGLGTGLTAAVVTGGLSAPMVAASPAVQKGTVDFGTKMSAHMSGAAGGIASSAVAGTVNAMKPEVHRSGNLTGDVSMMSYQTPYLIISSPNKPRLVNQSMFTGFPSYKSGTLNEFSGFTQVIEVHVEGIPCTEVEREMIISMLKEGVIL